MSELPSYTCIFWIFIFEFAKIIGICFYLPEWEFSDFFRYLMMNNWKWTFGMLRPRVPVSPEGPVSVYSWGQQFPSHPAAPGASVRGGVVWQQKLQNLLRIRSLKFECSLLSWSESYLLNFLAFKGCAISDSVLTLVHITNMLIFLKLPDFFFCCNTLS